jgi:hypothetical protein
MGRSRRELTLADYVAIAISPVLIMTLVGSLVFFLLEVVYRGDHATRIQWVLICFVGGMVLVARIGIEQGVEQAQLYGGVLLVVALLFAMRFLDSFGIAAGLLCLIAFCAWKLTWDCTLVDDSEDASGEGLLQATGLDPEGARAAPPGAVGPDQNSPSAGPSPALRSLVVEPPPAATKPVGPRDELRGVRAPVPTVLVSGRGLAEEAVRKSEFAERTATRQKQRKRPHSPGVWVVYFSLAALPLFGLGQLLIPATQEGRRGYAFGLLVIYVASGLGLLLTTSFLGLRRYLRQRGISMPGGVTRSWLVVGLGMALLVLGLATLLPRPSGVYTMNDLIDRLDKQVDASRFAILGGDAGQGDGAPGSLVPGDSGDPAPRDQARAGQPAAPSEGPAEKSAPGQGREGKPAGTDPSAGNPPGQQPGDQQQGGQQQEGQPQQGQPQASQQQPSGRPENSEDSDSQESGEQGSNEPSASESDPPSHPSSDRSDDQTKNEERSQPQESQTAGKTPPQPDGRQGAQRQPGQSNNAPQAQPQRPSPTPPGGQARPAQPPNARNRPPGGQPQAPPQEAGERGEQPSPSPPSSNPMSSALSGLLRDLGAWGGPLKWLIYAVLALVGLFLLFRHARQIVDFLARLWQAFLGLFGGGQREDRRPEEEPAAPPAPKRYVDFPNPYANGTARRMKLPQLLDYSFQALEAWARERRVPLRTGQTPLEFAQAVVGRVPSLETDVTRAAQLYAQVAYGQRTPTGDHHEVLERLWRRLDDTSRA